MWGQEDQLTQQSSNFLSIIPQQKTGCRFHKKVAYVYGESLYFGLAYISIRYNIPWSRSNQSHYNLYTIFLIKKTLRHMFINNTSKKLLQLNIHPEIARILLEMLKRAEGSSEMSCICAYKTMPTTFKTFFKCIQIKTSNYIFSLAKINYVYQQSFFFYSPS